jgi:hypothetical protein
MARITVNLNQQQRKKSHQPMEKLPEVVDVVFSGGQPKPLPSSSSRYGKMTAKVTPTSPIVGFRQQKVVRLSVDPPPQNPSAENNNLQSQKVQQMVVVNRRSSSLNNDIFASSPTKDESDLLRAANRRSLSSGNHV